MRDLITQIKQTLPFDGFDNSACSDTCSGCSVKLINFLENELEDWEYRLNNKEVPNFKDINKLAKMATKIHRVLVKNNLIKPPTIYEQPNK